MIDLLLEAQNAPFTIALALMLGIGALEALAVMFGGGISQLLGDAGGLDADADASVAPDGSGHGAFFRFLDWLHVGRVPLLAALVVFLMCFGLCGLALQAGWRGLWGSLLSPWIAAPLTFVGVLPLARALIGLLARVMPRDQTTAVRRSSFVGRIAVVTTGKATFGGPAPAKLRDEHGQTHHVLVEPDDRAEAFDEGCEVILVSQQGAVFRAIRNVVT